MSPTDAGRFTHAALATRRPGPSVAPPRGDEFTSGGGGASTDGAPGTESRPVTPARVGPYRGAYPHRFNDPCNYLG
jgi:hypothetical protein